MNKPAHADAPASDTPDPANPVCLCYVIRETDRCPVHLFDRTKTTGRRRGVGQRVINTTKTLRGG